MKCDFILVMQRFLRIIVYVSLFIVCSATACAENTIDLFGALPVKGVIYDLQNTPIATTDVYLNYVEIFVKKEKLARVGIMSNRGTWELFIVRNDAKKTLIGYADKGILYDSDHKNIIGYYTVTPVFIYVYDEKRKKVGHAKCIAWQPVCGAAVASYLLHLI